MGNQKLQMESELSNIISSINDIGDITRKVTEKLWGLDQERVYLPSLEVDSASTIDDWTEENFERLGMSFEYVAGFMGTGGYCINFDPSRLGEICATQFLKWFHEITKESGILKKCYGSSGSSTDFSIGEPPM